MEDDRGHTAPDTALRREPGARGIETDSPIPPVTNDDPVQAAGSRLIAVADLGERRVREVSTSRHGVLAVGLKPDGTPFAVSNVCRHQFGKLGRGRVTEDGCLECPWHRARYDVASGTMSEGPKGRIFGFKPYSKMIEGIGHAWKLRTFDVELREGAIYLAA